MKYLLAGIGILALLLCAGILVTWRSDRCLDETESALRLAADHFPLRDFPAIRADLDAAQAVWHSHHGFFGSILSHTELEEVNGCFASLLAYAEQEMAELKDAYARLTAMLAHLREADHLRYYNILAHMLTYN